MQPQSPGRGEPSLATIHVPVSPTVGQVCLSSTVLHFFQHDLQKYWSTLFRQEHRTQNHSEGRGSAGAFGPKKNSRTSARDAVYLWHLLCPHRATQTRFVEETAECRGAGKSPTS